MDLLEYQGKQLFSEHGIQVPSSALYEGEETSLPSSRKIVVKAQVPVGKRKKYGGIKVVDRDQAIHAAGKVQDMKIAGEPVQQVLLEEAVDIDRELYISLSINRAGKNYHLVFSEEGGSGIESVSEEDPEAVHILDFYEFDHETIRDELASHGFDRADDVASIVQDMHTLMREEDALLVEINPLIVTATGDIVALDSKVRIDENALFRHEFEFQDGTGLESRAEQEGLEFVNLDGNIAVIGNGAGLVMATLDSINHFGGKPADFLDIGGGADFEKMKRAMSIALSQDDVDALFVNIFGGITRCDEVAEGIVQFVDEQDIEIPMVVRLVGTNQQEGRQILQDNGIHALDSMDKCAEKIVDLAPATE